jgi:hypothetical protein
VFCGRKESLATFSQRSSLEDYGIRTMDTIFDQPQQEPKFSLAKKFCGAELEIVKIGAK